MLFKKLGKPIPDDFHLTLDNYIIKPEKTVKLLGVTLDQHLTFVPHVACDSSSFVTDIWRVNLCLIIIIISSQQSVKDFWEYWLKLLHIFLKSY